MPKKRTNGLGIKKENYKKAGLVIKNKIQKPGPGTKRKTCLCNKKENTKP